MTRRIEGTLTRIDLGTGGFLLETSGGRRYLLDGDVPDALVDHLVVVEGREAPDSGFLMVPADGVIAVTRIWRA